MKQISLEDFKKEAIELFGEDNKAWKFVCPMCKTPQSALDWDSEGIDRDLIPKQIGFSCIGRHVKDKGCDWTLGGLFKFHTLEIIDDEGNSHPYFELLHVPQTPEFKRDPLKSSQDNQEAHTEWLRDQKQENLK